MMRPVADLEVLVSRFGSGRWWSVTYALWCVSRHSLLRDMGLAYFAGDVKVDELSAFVLHFD